MRLEWDARGVADREMGAIPKLRLFEPLACHINARRREVEARRLRRTRLDQPDEQTPTPAPEFEHRPADRVQGQERIFAAISSARVGLPIHRCCLCEPWSGLRITKPAAGVSLGVNRVTRARYRPNGRSVRAGKRGADTRI
jgi:hypothetical protein